MKRSALGRGLDALITMDDLKTGGSSSISEIELSKIQPNPDQPRSVFEEETLEELATSIRSLGVIQPITLKETGPDHFVACHFADELSLDGIGDLKIKNECVGGKKDE